MKTFETQAAQGDLMLCRINEVPSDAREKAAVDAQHVVAHSETGHHHTVAAKLARFFEGEDPLVCYLQIDAEYADLVHHRNFDTHETIRISRGCYEIRRQREHTPEGWRRVDD